MDMTWEAAIYFSLSPARDFPRNFARKSSNNCQCYCKKKIYIHIVVRERLLVSYQKLPGMGTPEIPDLRKLCCMLQFYWIIYLHISGANASLKMNMFEDVIAWCERGLEVSLSSYFSTPLWKGVSMCWLCASFYTFPVKIVETLANFFSPPPF